MDWTEVTCSETLCKELEKAEGELTSVNDRVLAASNDLSLLVKQKAENDEFYNKKVEVDKVRME